MFGAIQRPRRTIANPRVVRVRYNPAVIRNRRLLPVATALGLLACGPDEPTGSGGEEVGDTVAETGDDPAETGDSSNADAETESESESESESEGTEQCDPSTPEPIEQDFLGFGDAAQDVTLPACEYHVWWVSAAKGVETTVTISASAPVEVAISYPDDPSFTTPLASTTLYQPGSLELVSPRSGEFAVLVRAQNPGLDPELQLDYAIDVACTNQCQFETTRFPIVMAHGWTGFENIGPITYFYNVREDLEDLGYPIAIAVLDPYNAVEIRGEQLSAFVGATLQSQRARKVNLIGHSQGGIDSRYVASEAGGGYGDRVGALITVGTPHYGTPFTDIALGLLPGNSNQILAFLLNFLGATQAQQSDAEASMYTLSETFMQEEFNVIYTDDPRVKYWSWTGQTCVAGIGCDDSLDPLLLFSYQTILGIAGPNDGLVPESSAQWGEYLGVVPADHIDEIGQIAGITSLSYDHVAFFRKNARMLRDELF
jgi:triacylglycerol esterase/lipase EstA (alpha/beta hydrolase family)